MGSTSEKVSLNFLKILKFIWISIYFQEFQIIKYFLNYLLNYHGIACQSNHKTTIKYYLLLESYYQIYQADGKLIDREFVSNAIDTIIPFKLGSQLSYLHPITTYGLQDWKIEETFDRILSRHQALFNNNPNLFGYYLFDQPLNDTEYQKSISIEYPKVKIIYPSSLNFGDSFRKDQQITYFPYDLRNPLSEKKFKNGKEILVLTQEILSYLVGYLLPNYLDNWNRRWFQKYHLVMDNGKFQLFDKRILEKYSMDNEKERWNYWKSKIEVLEIPEEDKEFQYFPENLNSRDYWIYDQILINNWKLMLWKDSGSLNRKYKNLVTHSVIMDHIFLYEKGFIKGSKGEKEEYERVSWWKKILFHIRFNYYSICFLLFN